MRSETQLIAGNKLLNSRLRLLREIQGPAINLAREGRSGDSGNPGATIGVPPCFRQDAVAPSWLAVFSRLLAGNEQAGNTTYRGAGRSDSN